MYLDERTEFADALALNTGAPATFNIGDVIDTRALSGPTTIDPNVTKDHEGSEQYLMIQVDTAVTGATTVAFKLVSDANATPGIGATETTHWQGPAIAVATLVAGYRYAAVPLPAGSYQRYIGIQQITAGAAVTAGKINAFLTNDPALWRPYADNVG